MFSTSPVYGLTLTAWFFSRQTGWAQAVPNSHYSTGDAYLLRETPCKDIDCAVRIRVVRSDALVPTIESTMDTIGFTLCAAYVACLARELLGVFYNADTLASGLE
jgi:hypothetical protein